MLLWCTKYGLELQVQLVRNRTNSLKPGSALLIGQSLSNRQFLFLGKSSQQPRWDKILGGSGGCSGRVGVTFAVTGFRGRSCVVCLRASKVEARACLVRKAPAASSRQNEQAALLLFTAVHLACKLLLLMGGKPSPLQHRSGPHAPR